MPVYDLKCPFTNCSFQIRLDNEFGIDSVKRSLHDSTVERKMIEHLLEHHSVNQIAFLAYRGIIDEYVTSLTKTIEVAKRV